MTRFPADPTNLGEWAVRKWREADVKDARAQGRQLAEDLGASTRPGLTRDEAAMFLGGSIIWGAVALLAIVGAFTVSHWFWHYITQILFWTFVAACCGCFWVRTKPRSQR